MKEAKNISPITVQQLATRLGKPLRTVQWMLKNRDTIDHVASFHKLSTGKTSPYVIIPMESFFLKS